MSNTDTYIHRPKIGKLFRRVGILIAALLIPFIGNAKEAEITSAPEKKSIDDMVDYAKTLVRRPYRSGATGPYAFDCSGFTLHCYKKLGIKLERTSEAQSKQGKRVRRRRLRPGDLVFFNGSEIGRKIGHVGIVISANKKEFTFIHASSSVGITTTSSNLKYYKDRYKRARRITSDKSIKRAIKDFANEEKNKKEMEEKAEKEALKRQKEAAKEAEKAKKEADKAAEKAKKEAEKEAKKNEQIENNKDNSKDNKQEEKTDNSNTEQTKPADTPTNDGNNRGIKTITGPYHTVVPGDTLYNISRRAGCSVSDLQKWNNLDGNSISVGQTIRVKQP